ncbi:response regulator [Aetokthonos hydrillicola Thurmond2011]|jgi:CheY-like chemotaxis protein|uniref:Response regulator n=1 Tax=Aetokthonos hydrillicola Thurmond2011 TaxID=2712845 RepID=A0AAP5M7C4_9CYAN|nr:response regulator [Aetokthonos hydrillicola]MBO3459343.1 response regulator [Aetokthonos hydrillicola CCALA 1050]MBW4586489.1 response regulator [Aetokthonos hydrillicola CCALA 1050]MDR9893567.1 response regulator [Aetokthonos hydrillicola Thurmond2011]
MALVLVIDDAGFARRMICKFLRADGYEIIEATNGREGLEIVRNRTPDCILTDILMPEMNGFEFLQALQEEGFQIPTIIITADIQEPSRHRGLELGAAGFINKPPKENELRQALRQVFSFKE